MKPYHLLNTLILLLLLATATTAQKAPIKWGKVDGEDLRMTVYEPDSSADAVILCDFGDLEFDFGNDGDIRYKFVHHRRIKILKQSGFDNGDISIPYYSKNKFEELMDIKVQIFSPDGEKQKVGKDHMFEEEINEYWTAKKISVPNIQEGSIIEYRYQILSEGIFELREWFFEQDIPVRWSEYRVAIPEWYRYVSLNQGVNKMKVENKEANATLTIPVPTGNYGTRRTTVNTVVRKARYTMEHAPALEEEAYITTMDDYRTRVRFQLQAIAFPNSPIKPILTDWGKVADDLLEDSNFGQQFLKRKNYKKVWEAVEGEVAQLEGPKERVEFLYNFVTNSMEWDGYYSRWVRKSLNDCYEKKTGRSGELNLMLLALLKQSNIEAYPVLISTRDHGRMFELYPILDQFNHVLLYLELDGKPTFLDAASPYRPINYPRVDALNSKGWVLIKDNPQWISIIPPSGSDTFVFDVSVDEEGGVNGNIKCKHEGYSAFSERSEYSDDQSGSFWKKRLEERFPDISLQNVSFKEFEDINSNFIAEMDCKIPDCAQVSGDFMYFSPVIHTNFEENPFKAQKRDYPVDIPYPFKEQLVFNLKIPEGYKVEELPTSAKVSLPNKGGVFQYFISEKENSVQVVSRIRVNQLHFEPAEYLSIKNFFDMILEKQAEQIILKKKE
ncbi:MAG: DUF3857 domain-containing protein [Bacteroidota bacterium]